MVRKVATNSRGGCLASHSGPFKAYAGRDTRSSGPKFRHFGRTPMTPPPATVFLIDVDNTLLDNDRVVADLRAHLEQAFGSESANRYWVAFEQLRSELG